MSESLQFYSSEYVQFILEFMLVRAHNHQSSHMYSVRSAAFAAHRRLSGALALENALLALSLNDERHVQRKLRANATAAVFLLSPYIRRQKKPPRALFEK